MRTSIIKDPTYSVYSRGGNVERRGKEVTKEELKKLAKKDQRLDIELELMSRIKEAFDKAKDQGYEGTIDQFSKEADIKVIKEIAEFAGGGLVDFSGLDVPTMKAIFRSENGRDPKSAKELVKGVKMYLKGMDIKGVPMGAFE